MRFSIFLLFFALVVQSQRLSNETYQDTPIELVQEITLREFLIDPVAEEPNDPFVAAIWDPVSQNLFAWTNGPAFAPVLYQMNYRDLLVNRTATNPFPYRNETFVSSGEYSVETGVYNSARNELIMAGSRSLYRFTSPDTSLTTVDYSFVFVEFILPFTSFMQGDTMWIAQFRGVAGGSPNLIGVNLNNYAAGPDSAATVNLVDEQMTSSFVSTDDDLFFLGGRTGIVQIRQLSTQALLATFTVNASRIGHFEYDFGRDLLYFCVDHANGVKLLRLDLSGGVGGFNGALVLLEEGANATTNVQAIKLLNSGTCEAIVIDTTIGVSFIAMADPSGIGFLGKVNLRSFELLIVYIPIQRENSRLVSIHLEQFNGKRYLYGVSTYTVAVWEYSTSCSLDCNELAVPPQGICDYGICVCEDEWWGLSCSTASCTPTCGDAEDELDESGGVLRGECIDGQCICQPEWTGSGCTQRRCPNDCTANGDCLGASQNWTCDCNDIREGRDCSVLKYRYCEELNDNVTFKGSLKDACLDLTTILGCGYCGGSTDQCYEGNRRGPVFDSCMWWFYDGWWNPAFIVFIVVMMLSWVLMFLANGWSMLVEDLKFSKMRTENSNPHFYGTKGYQKKLWWRDERSHKAWKMFDQMQFLSAYGIINAWFTTKLYNFLTFWNFSLFVIPLGGPFYNDEDHPNRAFNWTPPEPINFPFPPISDASFNGDPVNRTRRALEFYDVATEPLTRKRDFEQFLNSAETLDHLVYPTVVIWFIITFFGFLILYGVYFLIMTLVVHKDEPVYSTILGYRFRHIIARCLHAFYFPAIFLAVFAIQVNQKPVIILAIVIGLIVIGMGLPIFFVLLTQQPLLTEWFDPALRIPFGSFYAPFKKNRIKFQLFVYFRKAAAACALGAMARGYDPEDEALFWAQMLVTLAAFVIYLVVLIWKRPYIDMIHMIVDAALTLLNAVTLLLSLLAIQADAGTQDALQWIVLVVQIPCMFLVTVAYLWSSMFYAGYTSPKQIFCCEGKPTIEGDDKLIQAADAGAAAHGGGGSAPKPALQDFSSDEALENLNLPSSEG